MVFIPFVGEVIAARLVKSTRRACFRPSVLLPSAWWLTRLCQRMAVGGRHSYLISHQAMQWHLIFLVDHEVHRDSMDTALCIHSANGGASQWHISSKSKSNAAWAQCILQWWGGSLECREGLHLSCGFFHDIFVPSYGLPVGLHRSNLLLRRNPRRAAQQSCKELNTDAPCCQPGPSQVTLVCCGFPYQAV